VRIRRLIQFATLLIASGVALSAGAGAQDEGATNGIATRAQTVTDAEQAKAEHLMPQEPPRGERKCRALNLAGYPPEVDSHSGPNTRGRTSWLIISPGIPTSRDQPEDGTGEEVHSISMVC